MPSSADERRSGPSPEMAHLCTVDPVMNNLIGKVGPYALPPPPRRSPFESLVRAIAYQQLHEQAAESILARFIALCPGRRFPQPADVLALEPERMRGAGFSRAKVAALQDLAAKALDGTVPTTAAIRRLDDDAIVERLVVVRGIGRWTVEMLLIFQLGRPNVLPVDDFGVRNGFRIAYNRAVPPTPQELLRYGERWRPHRTAAAWYLWRAVDQAKAMRAAMLPPHTSTKRVSNGRPA